MNTKRKRDGALYKAVLVSINIILIIAAYYIAFYLKFDRIISPKHIGQFYQIIPYLIITSFVFFYVNDVFGILKKSFIDIIYSSMISLVMINITTVAILFLARTLSFPRSVLMISSIIQVISVFIWTTIMWKRVQRIKRKKDAIIIGNKTDSDIVLKKVLINSKNHMNIKFICNKLDDEMYKYIDKVDEVIISPGIESHIKDEIITHCIETDKIAYLVPSLSEISLYNASIEQFDDIPTFKIDSLYMSLEKRFMKRTLDLFISIIGLILTIPIMLVVAIIIKLYDRGNILFSQERLTRDNKTFKLYKFRTMVVDAEKHTGPTLATEKDPRITPLGRILRSTRLDELPQLFNVLMGDMSIVGPRPEREYFAKEFIKDIPDFKYRVIVKAGVTGFAQVWGKYSTSPENKIRYDLLYIRNYSFLLDLKLILETIKVMFVKESSEGVKEEKSVDELLEDENLQKKNENEIIELKNDER
ncbi:sugar transferase [Senegalia sp. (in: firmicutes)]|uniref:sugar transferase n=1 Tax=Senegalia sp. (in: firmicutes) TaxID=1924098 RepID=UPI003F9BC033